MAFAVPALVFAAPVSASVTQGNVFDVNALSAIYSLGFVGSTIGSNNAAFFSNPSPLTYTVTRQGSTLAAGDTITAGEQSLGLQFGLTFDLHSLNLTVTTDSAVLGSTLLTNSGGGSLDGATVHGVKGSLSFTVLDAAAAPLYAGTFIFRQEDANVTRDIATDFNGLLSVFIFGGSGGLFQTEPDASGAVLQVLDPNSPIEQTVDAAVNGLGLSLAFGDPVNVPEPATLPLLGAAIAGLAAARRRRP